VKAGLNGAAHSTFPVVVNDEFNRQVFQRFAVLSLIGTQDNHDFAGWR